MTTRAAAALSAIFLAFCPALAKAGPCANEIYQANVEINKRLDAIAAKGKAGAESNFATTHRQPTPATIAGAEEKLGDISEADVKAVGDFMAAARQADAAGDKPACEKAIADAKTLLKM